ncbi:alpha/beta hydrolase [Anaerostipes sp.]|uniref:alpha/beta hydrolase n=1 Tax=Anaerostipes sp. TaxID=1872530 RepID=UPI0025BDB6AD|nr:alpha/beta hydrolase [Anaerostipes sp.]MBS7007187.1 alpha/beta hydrolase [Anaerostipes sp.]
MRRELFLKSDADGHRLHVLLLAPETKPKAVVQICHGMSEHKERYLKFMKYLLSFGYAAVIHDHRGHGKSIERKDDLGYFYDTAGKAVVEDAHQVTKWAKEQFPDVPLHLFGHSMGSLVVRCYLKKYDEELASLTVCGSPSRNALAKPAVWMAQTACRINGERKKGVFFQKLAFGTFQKILKEDESENGWISYDRKNVKKYDDDPLDGFVFTNNGFLNLFHLMDETYSKKGWCMGNPDLPILFIAGQDDPCIVSEKEFWKAVSFLKHMGYKNIRGKLYKGCRHEILNEKCSEEVFKEILAFIE